MSEEEQLAKYGFIKYKKGPEEDQIFAENELPKPDLEASAQWARQNVRPQMVRTGGGKTRRAEMGERGTQYSVYHTTLQELAHFGLGVGMYFWYLKQLFFLLLIMAAIDTYNLDYFSGDKYSPGGFEAGSRRLHAAHGQPGVHWMMRGSATCTAATEVEAYLIGDAEGTNRAVAAAAAMQSSYSSNTVTEIHNLCQIHKTQGIVNLVSLMVFFVYMIVSKFFYDSTIEDLDEGMQTASDYTVVVQDPPAMSTDPDDWYDFFKQFGQVALVSVVFDNGLWMQKNAYLRYNRKMYIALTPSASGLPPGMTVGTGSRPAPSSSFGNCCGMRPPQYYLNEIRKTVLELKSMAQDWNLQNDPTRDPDPFLRDPPSLCGGLCVKDTTGPLVRGWSARGGSVSTPNAAENNTWTTLKAVYPPDIAAGNPKKVPFYQSDKDVILNRSVAEVRADPELYGSAVGNPNGANRNSVLWWHQPSDIDDVDILNNLEFTLREVLSHRDTNWDPAVQSEDPALLPPSGLRASKVFVTFQHEKDQRNALMKLKVSKLDAWFDTGSLPDKYKFNWGPPLMMKDQSGELISTTPTVLDPSAAEYMVACESDIIATDLKKGASPTDGCLMARGLDAYYFNTSQLLGPGEPATKANQDAAFTDLILRNRQVNMADARTWETRRRVQKRFDDVLLVEEAPEPTEINWNNIRWRKPFQAFLYTILRGFMGLCVASAVVAAIYFIIKAIQQHFHGRVAPALAISVANVLLPPIMLAITQIGQYWNQTLEQSVYFWKLLLSRFLTTAVINFALTDFDQMLDEDSIYRIQAILFADMVTAPFLKWLNPWPRFQRWYYAPRAKTQLAANMYYAGEPWQLADRYTDMLKTVFLVMFYAVLLPSGFWIAMAALFISYWVDKYMLLTRWVRKPEYGTSLPNAAYAATYLCLLGALYMSLYFYVGWPFDYACSANDDSYGPFWHCERNSEQFFGDYFWPHVQGYMTNGQRQLIRIFRSVDVVALIIFIVGFLAGPIYYFIYDLIIGAAYEPVGDDIGQPFTSVDEIQGYIPVVTYPGLDVPLIGTQVSDMANPEAGNGIKTLMNGPTEPVQVQPDAASGQRPGTYGRPVPGRVGASRQGPFNTELVPFKPPTTKSFSDFSMLEDQLMVEEPNMMRFSLTSDVNGYPMYYSRVKEYVSDDSGTEWDPIDRGTTWCVCIGDPKGIPATIARCCGCSFCLLATIAFVFLCFALALMHFCKHVDTSTVDSFEVPDTAFTDELLMANDSPHGSISVVRTHYPQQYAVQVVAINYARDLASSEGITLFDADVYRNEYSYEEFASVTAFTEFNSRWRILGYNVDCKNAEIMARIPQYLPSLRRVVARAAYWSNVVFEMQDPYTLEVATAFEVVNVTVDRGDVEFKGLKTTKWGIVDIRTEIEHNSKDAVVELFNVMPNILNVQTVKAAVKMERIWMYDGGLLSVSTHSGRVDLENVVMFGHYGSIVVETHAADITITLNARYFNGAFNLQSEKGLVYIDPGQFMAYEGGSPEECSSTVAWNGMPVRRKKVPGHHSHCLQGRLGMPSGYNKLIVYSKHGSIKVQFASFVEQPPGMYV